MKFVVSFNSYLPSIENKDGEDAARQKKSDANINGDRLLIGIALQWSL